jgi:hypothetical protein
VFDFVYLNLNAQFSSAKVTHEIFEFFGALAFSLITFALTLRNRSPSITGKSTKRTEQNVLLG